MKRLLWLVLPVIIVAMVWVAVPGVVERRFNHTLHPPPYQPSAQAEELHRKLLVADLHADSLLWGRNLLRRSARGHVDIPRLAEGNVAIQAFTVVTTSPRKLNIYRNSDSSDMVRYLAILKAGRRAHGTARNNALFTRQSGCKSLPHNPMARWSLSVRALTFSGSSPRADPHILLPVFWALRVRSHLRANWKIWTTFMQPASA